MIMPSDKEYQLVKRVKKEGKPLPSPFRELAAWILGAYQIPVLHITYDTVSPGNRPRLQIVFEFDHEKQKFCEPHSINFDAAKQAAIRDCFLTLIPHSDKTRFQKEGPFVVFSAFEGVARIEANGRVTKREAEKLQRSLNNENLWLIRPAFDGVVFFFHTNAQVQEAEANGLREIYTREYARMVEPYDEFGYLQRRGIPIGFDSKQNFDANFQSNWFYYDR